MKTKLERAIEKLRDIDDWEEDSSVNIMIHNEPPKSRAPMPIKMLGMLTPWQRTIVILAFIAAAVASGVGSTLVLHTLGIGTDKSQSPSPTKVSP